MDWRNLLYNPYTLIFFLALFASLFLVYAFFVW